MLTTIHVNYFVINSIFNRTVKYHNKFSVQQNNDLLLGALARGTGQDLLVSVSDSMFHGPTSFST